MFNAKIMLTFLRETDIRFWKSALENPLYIYDSNRNLKTFSVTIVRLRSGAQKYDFER